MKIKDLIRDNLTISERKFCKIVGVNRETISAILNDRYNHTPTILTIKKICKYFNVDYKDYIE